MYMKNNMHIRLLFRLLHDHPFQMINGIILCSDTSKTVVVLCKYQSRQQEMWTFYFIISHLFYYLCKANKGRTFKSQDSTTQIQRENIFKLFKSLSLKHVFIHSSLHKHAGGY